MADFPRSALITGAGKRIGRALALDLASQGWNIAVHYHQSETEAQLLCTELESMGMQAVAVQANLEDKAEVETLISRAVEALGPLTLLVNNAALFERDTLHDLPSNAWDQNMQVNLHAPVILASQFALQLRQAGIERPGAVNIINLTDSCVGWSLSPAFFSYTLSKTGLETATRLMAQELAPIIRVNAVAPGPTLPSPHDKPGSFEKICQATPAQTGSQPEDVCRAIRFILESPCLTGQSISLSGGLELSPTLYL